MTPIDKTWYQRPPQVRQRTSAGGVVARLEAGTVLIALAREAQWPLFILPKGGVEAGETLEQAARREIAEEAGLSELRLLGKLGVRERLSHDKARWLTVHYFLFATRQIEGLPTDRAHHYGLWWHSLHALPELLWPEQLELIQANAELIDRLIRQS
jgi:ADP-ribose pyrophosphatase YjhB (NUDIX family)